ncbi:predicted protein [Botrytis cinerea T4]|uniref:Uncharacterized protein n=1 Tax=Botryotinia fuckeliana (strain T4) TaxID=999810 RepID=G2XPG3_BOTF4|nr:predicted protein [Botrytis cinerea T4]
MQMHPISVDQGSNKQKKMNSELRNAFSSAVTPFLNHHPHLPTSISPTSEFSAQNLGLKANTLRS